MNNTEKLIQFNEKLLKIAKTHEDVEFLVIQLFDLLKGHERDEKY